VTDNLRHFLTLKDLEPAELQGLILRANTFKQEFKNKTMAPVFTGKTLAMIFDKSSTRTRVSFEAAMAQLGGHSIFLSPRDSQLGRGEPVEDTARVLSNMVDCVMIRTFAHENLVKFAEYSSIPIINGLTDSFHPCQLLADLQTYYEYRGPIQGKTVTWIGDGNNMCHSYINAASLCDFNLRIACPEGYAPDQQILDGSPTNVELFDDPEKAVKDSDLVITDVWASMGQEDESESRSEVFLPYKVTNELLSMAAADALFMHCLPAHRGEEVTAEVIDGEQSVVWEEAGNRLHSQKALLEFLLR
jgi:ornithine carbamoyltransferase